MAGHHGPVTAVDAARLLNVTVAAADAMLTELAKREPERIAIDVDDQGVVWYRLARPFAVAHAAAGERERTARARRRGRRAGRAARRGRRLAERQVRR